jgi:hypothetical protein
LEWLLAMRWKLLAAAVVLMVILALVPPSRRVVKPHAGANKDKTRGRGGVAMKGKILVIGLLWHTIGGHYAQVYRESKQPEQDALDQDDRFQVLDAFGNSDDQLREAIESSDVLINYMVLRMLCAFDPLNPSLDNFFFVANAPGSVPLPRLFNRLKFLYKLLSEGKGQYVHGGWFGDIHPYSFGKNGFSGAMKCFKDLNLSVLLARYMFNSDMVSLSTGLMETHRQMRVVWMPYHVQSSRYVAPATTEKDYDVSIVGNFQESFYPMRYRLANLIKSSSSGLSYIWCHDGQAEGFHRNGTKEDLGACLAESMHAVIRRTKLSLVTGARANYLVFKYFEIPLSGTVLLGNLPYGGSLIFGADEMVKVRDSETDAQILEKIHQKLQAPPETLQKMALAARKKVENFPVSEYANRVWDAVTQEEAAEFNPIPTFIKIPKHEGFPTFAEHSAGGSWDGLVGALKLLAQKRGGENDISNRKM